MHRDRECKVVGNIQKTKKDKRKLYRLLRLQSTYHNK